MYSGARVRSLRSIRPGTITVERPSALANSLLFAPVLGTVTVLPWLSSPTTTYGPIVTTLLGVGWLAYAALSGLRPTRIEIPVPRGAVLVLAESKDGLDSSYRVLLDSGTHSELVLDHDDPARALDELRRLQRELGLEVRPGWGLSAEAIREPVLTAKAKLRAVEVEGPRWQAQARTTLASAIGSMFVLAVTAYTFAKVLAPASTLSRVLPVLFAVLIGLAAVLLLTLRVRVRVSERGVRVDTSMFYLSFEDYEVSADSVLRADAVSASRNGPQHVLLQTTNGVHAIPLVGAAAATLSRAIRVAPEEDHESESSWSRPMHSQAVSLEENPC
jgi:hypothetical protein